MSGDWQPGDTAPKDGTDILCAWRGYNNKWMYDVGFYCHFSGWTHGDGRRIGCDYWKPLEPPTND